ncbi:hypothetical protein NDU88_003298 [Pleurodeles waltl]|uniref:Eukaryotic translation initiation factor 2 subunit 2 n=1 Tax=Pleurodeles waltl TaxID=8319 RepID=A0AAV7PHR9_PLEWA|nr:hypothetical protein NDU88_003298 [Pleurodeles waltl]
MGERSRIALLFSTQPAVTVNEDPGKDLTVSRVSALPFGCLAKKEYVTCHTCRSPDTILQKDTRLYFLQCETCHSRCSVASIKTGFQAVTGKRAQLRAKAN